MSTIYSALPNPYNDLGELRNEFAFLFNFFNQKEIKRKVDFTYAQKQTVDEITSDLIAGQKEIRLFHFSGHSGVSGLHFTDAQFDDDHIIQFFSAICAEDSRIDCVFLNGCENATIVNKLSQVPVVIGTKSRIEDTIASKFTQDFFSALIQSENTYRKAFEIAVVARNQTPQVLENTSAERGIRFVDKATALNDYFMVVNKPGAADEKFPFNRGKTNWTKYLLLFFVLIALFLGFLFKDSIFKTVGGYSCDRITTEKDKCNIVIADFAADPALDFDRNLELGVMASPILQKRLHTIRIGSFEEVIHNNSIHVDSLPSYCDYDFNLTGSLVEVENNYRARFFIFPNKTGIPPDSFVYDIKSIDEIFTLSSTLDETNANQFVLIEMCFACAREKGDKEFLLALNAEVEKFDPSHASAMYQRLQYSLAELNLHFSDTTAALMALNKMGKARGNDLALKAVERKVELYSKSKQVLRLYETQTELVDAIHARVQTPDKFELQAERQKYAAGENRWRMTRAQLVINHQDGALRQYQSVAIRDLEYLQRIKFQDRDFSRELQQLKGEQIKVAPTEDTERQFHLMGRVVTESGLGIDGAILTFGNLSKTTDEKGRFDFGSFDRSTVIGKPLRISRRGHVSKTVKITEKSIEKIMLKSELGDVE